MTELFAVIGYNPEHGRSSYLIRCACGTMFDFYVWSVRKRCPGCKKLYHYSRGGVGIFDEKTWATFGSNGQVIA